MTVQEVIKKVKTGVCKIEFYSNGVLVNSGSCFVHKNRLITNSHVFHPEGTTFSDDTKLVLIFGDNMRLDLTVKDLELITGSTEEEADFAVYNISKPKNVLSDKYDFQLSDLRGVLEGDEVLILGFPFETESLTTHYGRISALFEEKNIKKIQIDASVNQGNSGGPLYHLASEKIIGIITRKQSGLYKDFEDLLGSFSNNIEVLKNVQKGGGGFMFSGISLMQLFEISQSQMLKISKNIQRSANTGIGYAFSCDKLLKENI